MSKKTSTKRLRNLKGNSIRTQIWLQRMDNILSEERKKGMTKFHLDFDLSASKGDVAKDFVEMWPTIQWGAIEVTPQEVP